MKKIFVFLPLFCLLLLPVATQGSTLTQPNQSKVIFLTIDADMSRSMAKKQEGSVAKLWYNPKLIQYLEAEQIPATFFVSGLFAQTYPDVIKSLAADPLFSIQNHSYDESGFTPHCYKLRILTTNRAKISQIEETQSILTKLTGTAPAYFRYPGLCHSQKDNQLVEKLGLKVNDGNIIVGDPFSHREKAMVSNTLGHAKDDGVIIMHIGGRNAPDSLGVLEQIIPKLRSDGYTFSHL